MQIKIKKCKTALSKSNLPGIDYSLNPYTGCMHKCVYCYAPNVLHLDRKNWGETVSVKKNIPVVLSKELRNKKPGRVGISTVTDPYQPVEKKYRLTRYCLEQLLIHDFPICVQTKSDLVKRDKDLLSKFNQAELMISIGTFNDSERQILEPFSSSIGERLKILDFYKDSPVTKSVFYGPIYPTIKKEEISSILFELKKYGVSKVMVDKFNFKPGVKENIIKETQFSKRFKDSFKQNNLVKHYDEVVEEVRGEGRKLNLKIVDAF